jgi:hypothetical protein
MAGLVWFIIGSLSILVLISDNKSKAKVVDFHPQNLGIGPQNFFPRVEEISSEIFRHLVVLLRKGIGPG